MLWVRILAAACAGATAASVALFAGCGDDTAHDDDGPPSGIADVIYEGGATDEALEALLAAELKTDPSKSAVFDWPADGENLSPDVPTEFCWHIGELGSRLPRFLRDPARFSRPPAPEGALDRALARALEPLLDGVRTAHAHGTPVTGPAYFLVFSTPSNAELVRVFTRALEYKPDEATWSKLKAPGEPITAKVVWADFETNRVVQGGGPWDGLPITVTISAAQ